MLRHHVGAGFAAGALALALATAPSLAFAKTENFHTALTGQDEVPSNSSKGTGTLNAVYNTTTHVLSWTLSYSGLTGPAIAAHFHGPAGAGKNAKVQVPLKGSLKSPIKGSAKLTASQAADLEAGRWYVNVHTKAHPGGEIRGQVEPAM